MFMDKAIEQALLAKSKGDVPIGAVVVFENKVIGAAGNETVQSNDPTAHAEMLVLRQAAQRLGSARLIDCDLYVTLEPCPMCAQAICFARIRRLYYGAFDTKGGGVDHGPQIFEQSTCNHKPDVFSGFQEQECSMMLKDFFAEKR